MSASMSLAESPMIRAVDPIARICTMASVPVRLPPEVDMYCDARWTWRIVSTVGGTAGGEGWGRRRGGGGDAALRDP